MGDSEIKEEIKEQNEPQKKAENAAKKKGVFKNMKAEFKRIVWPDKNSSEGVHSSYCRYNYSGSSYRIIRLCD